MNKLILFSLILSIFLTQTLLAQIPSPCPSPAPAGAETCEDACVYCDLQGYSGTNNGTPSGGLTICGSIALHNDQWFGFIAGSSTITMEVESSNCQNGDGLQLAFFKSCSDPDAIMCNAGTPGGANTTLDLTYNNFIPGETYYLIVDGWSGDICDFQINIADGSVNSVEPLAPAQPQGLTTVCPGTEAVYTTNEVAWAEYYTWIAPPGSLINGMSTPVSIPGTEGTEVTITYGSVGGNICVQAGNACNAPSAFACLPIINFPIPPTVLPTQILCAEDLPLKWTEAPYTTLTTPGIYQLVSSPYLSMLGCDSIVRQTIQIQSPIITNLGTIFLCQGSCYQLDSMVYCTSDSFVHRLSAVNGCDSLISFKLEIINLSTFTAIESPEGKAITCLKTSLPLQAQGIPGVSHIWKNLAGDTLGTGNSINVQSAGFYFHEVQASSGGTTCTAQNKILIKENLSIPPITALGGTIDADYPTVQLKGNSILSGVTYSWTGPNGFASSLKQPVVAVPGLYTLTVTNPQTGCSNSITVEVLMMI